MDSKRNKPIIGLTGGIGAGKSSVALILSSLGAAVIDFDKLSHDEFRGGEVISTLLSWWGDRICPGGSAIDRSAVAAIVFEDRSELARLEGLLYPRLAKRRDVLIATYMADPDVKAVLLDAPKLYEAGLEKMCDAVIFVDADRQIRAQRLVGSRGWTEAELIKRENSLEPLDSKRKIADYVVVNHSSIADLRPGVERIFASVLADFS